MTASKSRDLIATSLRRHRDVADVRFARSAFNDRLAMNVYSRRGGVWPVWIGRDTRTDE